MAVVFWQRLRWPGATLIDRYLWFNLLPSFIFATAVFTALALSVGTVFDLVRQVAEAQMPLSLVLKIIWLQLPYVLTLVFPMAVLLAVLSTMGRLVEDGEWTALRSVGISLYRVLIPLLLFAFLVSGITFLLNETWVPLARYQSEQLMASFLRQEEYLAPSEDIFYPEYGPDNTVRRLYYARRFDGLNMQGLTVLDFSQPDLTQVINAESAQWNSQTHTWRISNGVVYLISQLGNLRDTLQFEEQQLTIPRPARTTDLLLTEIRELSIVQTRRALLKAQKENDLELARALTVHLQQSYAQPFLAVVFALMGVGFGLSQRQRRGRQGFGLGVGLVFGQYVLTYLTAAMGMIGWLTPLIAAWLPHGIGIGVAMALIFRVNR